MAVAKTFTMTAENARRTATLFERFSWAAAASEAADISEPIVTAALRRAAPYRSGGHEHLRDSIHGERRTTTRTLTMMWTIGVPWGKYVLEGTAPHTITPDAARALHWVDDGGQSMQVEVTPEELEDKVQQLLASIRGNAA